MVRILSNDEISEHLDMENCLSRLEVMFEEMGKDRSISKAREDVLTPVEHPHGKDEPVYHLLKTMGGSMVEFGVAAVRINSNLLTWKEREGTTVKDKIESPEGRFTGLVMLFDIETQNPLAIFPDGVLQSYRVAGTNALGVKHLAKDDASTLGMLGTGWQARAHIQAIDIVRDLDTAKVYSRTPENREAFVEEMDPQVSTDLQSVSEPEAVFEGADIIQCATNSLDPVFEWDWVEPGTHMGLVREVEPPAEFWNLDHFDSFVRSWTPITQVEELSGMEIRERYLPARNLNYYVVGGHEEYPDLRDRETRDEALVDWDAAPSLSDVLTDDSIGRSDPEGLTAFINMPPGQQFAAIGKELIEVAEERDLGHTIPTELLTQDVQGV